MTTTPRRKLIEVSIPLEAINKESAREKSIRHGHPSTLHLWWARRPLATCRAVLFAQLVDDPSSRPEEFPTEEDQNRERARLHALMERLVIWENTTDEKLLAEAHAEIVKSCNGNPPPILDPFAGGGSIPLEAQRLGLETHAADLNPVAVLINKALIEIPPKFAGRKPVHPEVPERLIAWPKATGLAEDVRRYGQWMRDEAERRIGHHYPQASLPDGSKATVIAWLWARTVTCPNPACGIDMPLVRSWWLSKKKRKEVFIVPEMAGSSVHFRVSRDLAEAPTPEEDGTVGRQGAHCLAYGGGASLNYIRAEGRAGNLQEQLMATVVEGTRSRSYLEATADDAHAGELARTTAGPDGELFDWPGRINVVRYGMTHFADLFTNRQLLAMTTLSDLVVEARERVLAGALAKGVSEGRRLADGGVEAAAYADAVATYLGLAVSRCSDYFSSICSWNASRDIPRNVFARQAIPMTWDFAEVNPFSDSSGNFGAQLEWVLKVVSHGLDVPATVTQASALDHYVPKSVISTDPPYYDNIGYSDLSDFFYVWLRRSLQPIHPYLLSTLLTPKAQELVANPYRRNGKEAAREYFESGFGKVFETARDACSHDFPITVYYAFKQAESGSDGESSTGWATILQGMVDAHWSITATWPMRSEREGRMLGVGTNALASSIVLALRPLPINAPQIDRRGFLKTLKAQLPGKLRELQQGAIAPVDLPQAAIGPGMAIFTSYGAVLDDDGSPMKVRDALARINEILDEVLSEQEGDFDSDTRFALAWFRQHGFDAGSFGDANTLANARDTAVSALEQSGILTSRGGKVKLVAPNEQNDGYDPARDDRISVWEMVMHLAQRLTTEGVDSAGQLMAAIPTSIDLAVAKELTFLLFSIAEDRNMTKAAVEFNALGTAWNEIVTAARRGPGIPRQHSEQQSLELTPKRA